MTDFVDFVHVALRSTHVFGGFVGLVLFWVIIALPKGTSWHLQFGKAFAWIAIFVGGSATISSLWALLHVDSFAPWLQKTGEQEATEMRELFAFFFTLLLFLGMATVTGAVFGRNIMRYRDNHSALRRTVLPFVEVLTGVASIWLTGFGVFKLCGMGATRVGLPWAVYQIPVILGVLGICGTVSELKFIYGAGLQGREWLYKHVEQMFGTGIAFHTAFAVFGFARLTGIQFEGPLALVPWTVPPAIGFAATSVYIKNLRRRNGDAPTSANGHVAIAPSTVDQDHVVSHQ